MRIVHFLFLILFFSDYAFAQMPHLPCGTVSGKSEWLKEYQKDPSRFFERLNARGSNTMYLPLTIHIVGTDDSLGMAGYDAVLYSFCELNQDFEATGIQFYIEQPIRYIYETDFFSHDSVKAGGIRMLQYNIPNTINVYFVGDPAGNCGYNLPYAGIAMGNGCISGHTFAHEMGHCLQLPHTFIGWEGGIGYNGPPVQTFSGPAPETVTINYTDFKDTIFLNDTLIIDTLYVEKVARTGATANCDFAADGFCDTPADYLAYRWLCSSSNPNSSNIQLDPDSVSFQSDGWYIMSYAFDACQVGFSQDQVNAMKSFVINERPNWLTNQSPNVDSVGLVNTIYPNQSMLAEDSNIRFEWNAVSGATHYFLEIYKEPYAVNQIMKKVLLTDTFYQSSLAFPPRPSMFPYAWRVYPFNYGNTCSGYNQPVFFNTVQSTSVIKEEHALLRWNIFPNVISKGNNFKLLIESSENVEFTIYNAFGQKLWSQKLDSNENSFDFSIPTNWNSGLHIVELKTVSGQQSVKKIIIH